MKKNKIMLLMIALIGINAGVMIGTEKGAFIHGVLKVSEKEAFICTVCKVITNIYAYNKNTIDKDDLKSCFDALESSFGYRAITSSNELIDVLEKGKTLLDFDILGIKIENKSAISYKKKEIATLDAIIEQIKLIQQSEVQ